MGNVQKVNYCSKIEGKYDKKFWEELFAYFP
jgi:hypothetical protein